MFKLLILLFILLSSIQVYSQDKTIEQINREFSDRDAKGRFGSLQAYFINVFYNDDAEIIKNILPEQGDIKKIIKRLIPELKNVPYRKSNDCALLFYYNITKISKNNDEYYGNIYVECLRDGKLYDTQYEDSFSIFWGISSFVNFYISNDDMRNSIKNNLESLIKDFAIKYYQAN